MFNNKCAEVFCQSFENFSVVCTDCNLKTNVFNDFIRHYQEIHCSLQPIISKNNIKQETLYEDKFSEALAEECSEAKLNSSLESLCPAITLQNESSFKNETINFEDEYVLDEKTMSDSDDELPLQQDLLRKNPLENSKVDCPKCDKNYCNRGSLRMHIHRFHPELKLPRLNSGNALKTCAECPGKTYSSLKAYYRHRRKKHDTLEVGLEPKANKAEANEIVIAADLAEKLTNESNIKTESHTTDEEENGIAESIFSNSDSDSIQSSREDDQLENPEFPCTECGKKYVHRKSLRNHFRRNHPDCKLPRLNAASTNKTCPDCPEKTYSTLKALQRHRRDVHAIQPMDTYPCPNCEKQFKSRDRVTVHLRIVHKVSKKPLEDKHYPCTQCDRVFTEKYILKRHEIRHTGIRSVICPVPECGQAFYDKKGLGSHRRFVHDKIKRFICDICGYSTNQTCSLQIHMRTHTGEKPYKCDQCDKWFTTSAAVIEHKVIHTSHIRPHVCDVCGKSFARPKALYHHKPLHLNIKKFVCKICGKAYAQQAGLSAHKRQHLQSNIEGNL